MTEKQVNDMIKSLETMYKREFTEEEKKAIFNEYGNPKAKDIQLRNGEVDFSELPQKKQFQFLVRELDDLNTRLEIIKNTNNDILFALMYLLKKKGSENPFQEIENFSMEYYEKMKKGD